jgi:signal transduction histidine kinase/ActR/RegA family two-component response regulator
LFENTTVTPHDAGVLQAPHIALEQRVEERTAELSQALAIVEAQKCDLENVLRMRDESQRQLEVELADARLLHSISAMLIGENTIDDLYQKLVDAAAMVMRSDYGSMQRYDYDRAELQLIAHRGLNDEAVASWKWVKAGQATSCGEALEVGKRVIVADVEHCEFISSSEDLAPFRKAGVKSAQSTPLLTRNGRLVGMISTQWTRCHTPPERDLRLLDIIARQAADLIERNTSAEALLHQAEALRHQTVELLEADRYKDEFLATLAHELRNPLAPIQTGLTVLKIGAPEQAPRVLTMMERQLGHMVRLIDDLLDVSRISRGMVVLKREHVQLGSVIDSAVDTSRPLINAAHHNFTVTVPGNIVWLHADATRVAQIISNLLNNAAKYTPQGGEIELIAELVGKVVMIRVIDSGIGIPAALQPKIFELFTQVDRATDRSTGGLGVGLALARQLAEMHGGSIEVESPGTHGGSVFTLRLPVAEAAAAAQSACKAPGHSEETGKVSRILIVDDNADAAEALALLLEQLGHTTSVVLEAPQAVAAALAFKPDVVFLDIGMPYLNGFDLARDIREQPELRHVCLAAVSGWGTDEDRAKSRKAGIDHHLTKPVMLHEVAEILSNVARRN